MWLLKPFAIFLLGIPVTLLGLPIVAIGLLFRRTYPETETPFTDPRYAHNGNWMLVRLPSWLKPWDNLYDGFCGDKRGYWSNQRNGKHDSFLSMWLWGATRNPANYWSRNLTGLDISRCTIVKLSGNCDQPSEEPGMKEWVHLRAYRDDGKTFDRFFVSWALPWDDSHAILIDIGWKIKLAHNGMSPVASDKDKIRGSVFTISPWKKLT